MKAKLTKELSLILDDPQGAQNLMTQVVLAKAVSTETNKTSTTTIQASGKSFKVREIFLKDAAAVKA